MATFSRPVVLNDELKEYIRNEMKPLLKNNDMIEARRVAVSSMQKNEETIKSAIKSVEILSFLLKVLGEEVYFENSDRVNVCEFWHSPIKSCVLPDNIKIISTGAFADSTLEEIILPPHLTTIDWGAFEQSNLKEVIIPSSVETIGPKAFSNCPYLKTVKFEYKDGEYDVEDNAFLYTDCVIYLPKEFESEDFYETSSGNKIEYY